MSLRIILPLTLLAAGVLWASIPIILNDAYITEHFSPNLAQVIIYSLSCLLVTGIRQKALIVFSSLWLVWVIVGTFYCISCYYKHTLWAPLYIEAPVTIFLSFVFIMIFAIILGERFFSKDAVTEKVLFPAIHALPILIFPAVYTLSILQSGHTILSGVAIVDDIYAVDRGILYPFRIVLAIFFAYSAIWLKKLEGSSKYLLMGYVAFAFFGSVLDGKRDLALIGVFSFIYNSVNNSRSFKFGRNAGILLAAGTAYGFLSDLRSGRNFFDEGILLKLTNIAGVEFRDFAHSINYWTKDYIETFGYDYIRSSVSMLLNSKILEIFGVDKNSWISLDSARTWQKAFQQDVGIRTGIISEIYYASSSLTFYFIAALFGLLISMLFHKMVSVRSEKAYVFLLVVSSVFTLSLVGQSSTLWGYVTTLIYSAIGIKVWSLFLSLFLQRHRDMRSR